MSLLIFGGQSVCLQLPMMTRLFLLTMFLLSCDPVYAGWRAVEKQYQPTGLETVYFDRETIHRNGIRATLWQLTDLKWNSTTRFLSTKTLGNLTVNIHACSYCKLLNYIVNFNRPVEARLHWKRQLAAC